MYSDPHEMNRLFYDLKKELIKKGVSEKKIQICGIYI